MTRTISLIIGIATAALVVGVPTAFGEGRLAGSPVQDGVAFFYANEQATLAQQPVSTGVSRPDSHEVDRTAGYEDAAVRAARIAPQPNAGLMIGDDHVTTPSDTSAPTVTSGRDIEWPALGVGLGIGIVLSLGLFLAYRSRQRPLAH